MTEKATVAELRSRVATAELELHASIETVTTVVEDAMDWKRAVREHPIQAAAVGVALGFLVLRSPKFVPGLLQEAGALGFQSLAGAGGGSMVNSLLRRFMPGRQS